MQSNENSIPVSEVKTYCIRNDYRHGSEAHTRVDDAADYWTDTRILAAGHYQYYVYKVAAQYLKKMKHRFFADVGCGYPTKVHQLIVPHTNDVVLIDQPSVANIVQKRFPKLHFSPLDLERQNSHFQGKFDCVVSADVIEHLLEPDSLLAFIKHILKPDGIALISTPERDIQRGLDCLYCPKPEHVREWNTVEFACYLKSKGFELIEHRLLPKGRLKWYEKMAFPLTKLRKGPRTRGCQLAVCRLSK